MTWNCVNTRSQCVYVRDNEHVTDHKFQRNCDFNGLFIRNSLIVGLGFSSESDTYHKIKHFIYLLLRFYHKPGQARAVQSSQFVCF